MGGTICCASVIYIRKKKISSFCINKQLYVKAPTELCSNPRHAGMFYFARARQAVTDHFWRRSKANFAY